MKILLNCFIISLLFDKAGFCCVLRAPAVSNIRLLCMGCFMDFLLLDISLKRFIEKLGEIDWTQVATVVISGVGIVLGVLIVLIMVFYAFGTLVSKSESLARARKEKKAQKGAKALETEEPPAEVSPAAVQAKAESAQSSDELIAVIAAAVAANEQGGGFVIKSIKKKNTRGANAWARAAVMDNTKPF